MRRPEGNRRIMFELETPPGRPWTAAQQIVRWLHAYGLSDETIATIINCDRSTINRIRHACQSGRNLPPRLARLLRVMRDKYDDP